jgi:hypothetical protein
MGTRLVGANLSGMDLTQALFVGANLSFANLSKATLVGANLSSADLRRANLREANLERAILNEATLLQTGLDRAGLSGASLQDASISRSYLSWTVLHGADLSNAHLHGGVLDGALLSQARLRHTALTYLDLRRVRGLETVLHEQPSSISFDTIERSGGKIPAVFLRGCGVPEDFVAYAGSLAAHEVDDNSYLMIYPRRDQAFVEELSGYLKAKHIKCHPITDELLPPDDYLRQSWDPSNPIYDFLLLVLSEHSNWSPWVQNEVQAVLDKERALERYLPQGSWRPTLLFPVVLNFEAMQKLPGWASGDWGKRPIAYFLDQAMGAYEQARDRLLRDLKAGWGRHI